MTFIRTLSKLTPEELKDLFARLSPDGVDSVSSILYNSIYTDLNLDEKQVKKIKKALASSEKDLRFIADSKNSNQDRQSPEVFVVPFRLPDFSSRFETVLF